jgi:hypothetical protein
MYVERCARGGDLAPAGSEGGLIVALSDWDSVAEVVRNVLEPGSIDVEIEEAVPAPI